MSVRMRWLLAVGAALSIAVALVVWRGTQRGGQESATPDASAGIASAATTVGPTAKLPAGTITILFTNDTHSHVATVTRSGWPASAGGAARRKTLVERVRAERGAENVLLFDAGDFSQGTSFYSVWKGSADVMAMNAIGYDAIALGYADFSLGPEGLGRALRGGKLTVTGTERETEALRAAVVVSNLDVSAEPALAGVVLPRAVIERGGKRYGVLGLLTTMTTLHAAPDRPIRFLGYEQAIAAGVAALRNEGVTRIILLSHCGFDEDRQLAPKLSGVDVIISAHDHVITIDGALLAQQKSHAYAPHVVGPHPVVVKDREGSNVLLVTSGKDGVWLGRLDVTFDDAGKIPDASWGGQPILVRGCKETGGVAEACPDGIPEDPDLSKKVALYSEPFLAASKEVIGTAGEPLVRGKLLVSPWGDIVADAALAAARAAGGADVAVISRAALRGDLEAGPVRREDLVRAFPFDDTIFVVRLNGEALEQLLGSMLTSRNTVLPSVAGMVVKYTQGDTKERDRRVQSIVVGGKPLDPKRTYAVAVPGFMARETGHRSENAPVWVTVLASAVEACRATPSACRDSGTTLREAVERVFVASSPVRAPAAARVVEGKP